MNAGLKTPEALSALLSGQNERALALLHNDNSPGATWARMRALLRLRNFDRAIEIAEQTNPDSLVDEEAVALRALHIFLLARVGRVDDAFASMPALRLAVSGEDRLGQLELQYIAGYLDYCTGQFDECIAKLEAILAETVMVAHDRRRYSFQLDAYAMRAKAATLIGVIHAANARFVEMERAHCEALLSAEQSSPRDTFLEALILANLSCSVGERYSASSIRLLQSRVHSFEWNAGLEEHRVYIKRHLRMAGYLFSAGLDIKAIGGRSAPSLAFRLAECVDSLLLDDWQSAEQFARELTFAKEFISRVDWSVTDGEEFTALIDMVPVLSPFDIDSATDAQGRFGEKLSSLLPHFTTGSGTRARASVRFAAGCIAKARGEFDVMRCEMQRAIEIWLSSGILWRAAIAAVELFTLTRDRHLLDTPRKFVDSHGGTPFCRRLERALERALESDGGTFAYLKSSIPE